MYYEEEAEKSDLCFNTTHFITFKYQASLEISNMGMVVNDSVHRMMYNMGYKPGAGLGKTGQGIVKPIDVDVSLNRRGIGYNKKLSAYLDNKWDFENDDVVVCEKVNWLDTNNIETFPCDINRSTEGPKLDSVDDTEFCDEDVFKQVFQEKEVFDDFSHKSLYFARNKSNPFETIRSAFFMNRAALKMANIDAATDFMFTKMEQQPEFQTDGPIYFADVCAGPGGFTEYLLWRRSWNYKGFGLTLKGKDDFKFEDSKCISPITFQALYGKKGDGDVCNPENISDFVHKVRNEADGLGVHFMMSDGGFSVEGHEELQEVCSKNIYLCQCYLALKVLRPHGSFVTKLFDIFTPFSAGLLYLMYLCFEKVGILKPNASRPANSERYFICKKLRNDARTNNIRQYLGNIVEKLWEYGDAREKDILEVVPLSVIKNDRAFFNYLYESNMAIARKQVRALKKMARFCENPMMVEVRQSHLKEMCLNYWEISQIDQKPISLPNTDELRDAWLKSIPQLMGAKMRFDLRRMKKYCLLSSQEKRNVVKFYFADEYSHVHELQKKGSCNVDLDLIPGTILCGELVKEKCCLECDLCETYRTQWSLHIIDAMFLGSTCLDGYTFNERLELIKKYCKALNKESSQTRSRIRLRPKTFKELSTLHEDIQSNKSTPFWAELPKLGYDSTRESFEVNSLFLCSCEGEGFLENFKKRYIVFNEEKSSVNFEKLLKRL